MKRVVIELSVDSCKQAIKELDQYKKSINKKMAEVCKRLAEIGRDEALAVINTINPKEGNKVDGVVALPIDHGYKIVMSGEDVYFIEFGTGDSVSDHYDTSVPVAWGTWSAENKQMLWKNGFWYYNKERLTGTPAYMPMYYAEKKMRESLNKVVSEVFNS